MKKTVSALSVVSVLLFSSCSKLTLTEEGVKVITETMDKTGNVIQRQTEVIADTSQYKERVYSEMRSNRDTVRGKAYDTEGLKIKYEQVQKTVTLNGTMGNQPINIELTYSEGSITEVTHKEPINFDNDPMPNGPSVHPGWKAFENITTTLGKYTFYGFLASEIKDIFTSDNFGGEKYNFNGSNYDFGNSFNRDNPNSTFSNSRIEAAAEETEEATTTE